MAAEVDVSLDELTAELATARAAYDDAKTRHATARREECDRHNEEIQTGKRYNALLKRLNETFGTVSV